MRLEIEIDVAATGACWIGPAAGAAMDGDRPAGFLGGRIDRMKQRMAERVVMRVIHQHHLDHPRITGMTTDLGRRLFGQLGGDHDGG